MPLHSHLDPSTRFFHPSDEELAIAYALAESQGAAGTSGTGQGNSDRAASAMGGAFVEPLLKPAEARAALNQNRQRRLPDEAWTQIAGIVNGSALMKEALVEKIAIWQKSKGLPVTGKVDEISLQWMSQEKGGAGLENYVKDDSIVYLGMNSTSSTVELAHLKKAAQSQVAGAIKSKSQDQVQVDGEWVSPKESDGAKKFLATLPGLDPGKAQKLEEFLGALYKQGLNGDEMAAYIRVLHEVETGKRLMKRMVFSGHSSGEYLQSDDGSSISFVEIGKLMKLFPGAASQVEDVMVSACNSGQEKKMDKFYQMFPNLKSVWAYAGFSPSAATGSMRHISEWEKSTRGHDTDKVVDGQEKVAKQGGDKDANVAVQIIGKGGNKSYHSDSPSVFETYEDGRAAVDARLPAYRAAYENGNIDQAQLNQLYPMLLWLTGAHGSSLGPEEAAFLLMRPRVFYLRHWREVSEKFMRDYKAILQKGYAEVSMPMPQFDRMPRSQALAQIAAFAQVASGADSQAALKVLTEGLRDLDEARVGINWR